jgi:hypothetical protein
LIFLANYCDKTSIIAKNRRFRKAIKDGGKELFPIRLRSEKEVKELPSISEFEEGK